MAFPKIYTDINLQSEMVRLLVEEPEANGKSAMWDKPRGIYGNRNNQLPDILTPVVYTQRFDNPQPVNTANELSYCVFCKKNGETREVYMTHRLKDKEAKIVCPVLSTLTCALCGATGEKSHTRSYCPMLRKDYLIKVGDRPPVLGVLLKKTDRNSTGKRKLKMD